MKAFAIGAIGALTLGAAGVAAASATPSRDDRGVEIIHALRTTEKSQMLDLGPTGSTLGDQQAFTARFDVDGRTIGFDGGMCVLVRLPQVYQCVATNSLPKGQLTAQGLVDFTSSSPARFAITGGTDGYRTAHGDVTVEFGRPSDRVTFRIITGEREDD